MVEYVKKDEVIKLIREDKVEITPNLLTIVMLAAPNGYSAEDCYKAINDTCDRHIKEIRNLPAADVVEVVRCRECKFWKDIHVLQNDGRERQYTAEEYDSDFTLMTPCVSSSVGINVGSKCMYDDQSGYIVDKTVFRGADDYCSKGEKRPCSYEKWWGIVDGYYPKEET